MNRLTKADHELRDRVVRDLAVAQLAYEGLIGYLWKKYELVSGSTIDEEGFIERKDAPPVVDKPEA